MEIFKGVIWSIIIGLIGFDVFCLQDEWLGEFVHHNIKIMIILVGILAIK